jgi:hypothetical protein
MNIVKLHDGSTDIVSDEELEACDVMFPDRRPDRPTPGPWGVEPEQATHGETLVVISRGEILARSPPAPAYGHREQAGDLANLTLMAAAPELAAVVRAFVYAVDTVATTAAGQEPGFRIYEAARAALAKAGL